MVLLITYGQTKTMYTNDMSIVRVHGYKDSMKRLDGTAKLRFSPQIPRNLYNTKKLSPVSSAFQTGYAPCRSPRDWHNPNDIVGCRSVHCLPAFLYSLGLTQLFRMVILVLTRQNPLQVGRIHHFFSSNPSLSPSYEFPMLLIVEAVELTLDTALVTVFNTDISLSALKTRLMLLPVTVTYATVLIPSLLFIVTVLASLSHV